MNMGIWSKRQSNDHKLHDHEKVAYSSNASFFEDVLAWIDIDLIKLDRSELCRKLFKDGTGYLARVKPSCPDVEDGDLVLGDLITD